MSRKNRTPKETARRSKIYELLQAANVNSMYDTDNNRNGYSSKRQRTSFGEVEASVPRDRKGEFEPQVLKRNQTCISQDVEEKILSTHAKGITTGDIEAHIRNIYGLSVLDSSLQRRGVTAMPLGAHLHRCISGRNPL